MVTSNRDADGDYEEHTFLEIDLGTEHVPRIQAKCRMYAAYAATGVHQAEHGLFPQVVWLSSDPGRRNVLRKAISATSGLPDGVFLVSSPGSFLAKHSAPIDDKNTSATTPVSTTNPSGLGLRSERQCQSDTANGSERRTRE